MALGVLGALGAGAAGGAVVSIVIQAIDQFSNVFAKVNKGMLLAGGAITALGVAGVGAVGGLLKMAGQFEQTEIAFTTMLGSAEEADKLLKELADFAAKTPFTIPGIEQNAKMLLAMSIEQEKLLPTLKSLGDIASGLNVPMERLALNFGQVKVQGKLTGRELRDFAVAGVPLIAELAKNLNVAESEVKEMVSAGKIGFDLVEQAFTSMTGEGGKFFDLMDAQSKTFLGQISNIQDSFIKIARVMGKIFLPAAKWVADKLAIIVAWMEEHPKLAKFAAVVLAIGTALALVIGPLLIMIAMLPLLAAGLGLIATGMTAVSIAGAPVWLIVLAIAAAIAALIAIGILLYKNWDIIKEKAKLVWSFLKNMFAPQIAIIKLAIKALTLMFRWLWDHGIGWVWEKMKGFYIWVKDTFLGILEKAISLISSVLGGVSKSQAKIGQSIETKGMEILGSRQSGGYIPQTGLYNLHEGEYVMPKNDVPSTVPIVISIENIYGTDPDEIAEALNDKLKTMISI